MKTKTIGITWGAAALVAVACKGKNYDEPAAANREEQAATTAPDEPSFGFGRSGYGPGGGGAGSGAYPAAAPAAPPALASGMDDMDGVALALDEGKMGKKTAPRRDAKEKNEVAVTTPAGGDPESPTRAWFPETFLFEPLVVTDAAGHATVPVRVPDRLTSWRVLALGHARNGAQGGAVTSFQSTLPVYVDLVAPGALARGDRARLPVQLVNTTDKPVTGTLEVHADNATVSGATGPRTIPAGGSLVEELVVTADRPGEVELKVGLRGGDAVVRQVDVTPLGRPAVVSKSGTLAAPRTLTLTGPASEDPATDRVRLQVFPGALALLRSELGVCTARGGVAEDAYALLLGGRAPALLTALGDAADPEAVRSLTILATQRAVRDARTLDLERATLFSEAALVHPESPVVTRLGERAASWLAQNQRPDGTFGGGSGWTLQRVLVATADATRAVAADPSADGRQRARGVAIRAAGAFERHAGLVEDAYTAAAILVSGAAPDGQRDKLRAKVREALVATDDGARKLPVAPGVVRADGVAPGESEATALAALALADDPAAAALRADLGATLLGAYSPLRGWGDGRANLVCMRAVVELFRTPVPGDVAITLTMDGKPVATGTLAADQRREVLTLDVPAPGLGGAHTWQLTAEPAVPGLGYALELRGWEAWPSGARAGGLELAAPASLAGVVGRPIDVALRAVAPSGLPLTVRYAVPAGVQADTPSLDALVASGAVSKFTVADDAITFEVPALAAGKVWNAGFRVVPTLGGTLHAGASAITGGATTVHVPPTTWTIR